MNAKLLTVIASYGLLMSGAVLSQPIVQQMVAKHRQSLVYLSVSKTTDTGEVVQGIGTGFIVSSHGHVLTSCHVVDKKIRDENGDVVPKVVDKVSVVGAMASKEAAGEGMTILDCAQSGIDLALLKFKNSAVLRTPVQVTAQEPTLGEEIAAMGFPMNIAFFARPGTLSSDEAEDDKLLVSMTLNPGDSGAPVFNKRIRVVAVAEGGYGAGSGIGIIRPIRHAAILLSMAGINLFAVDSPIQTSAVPDQPANSNVFSAPAVEARKAFSLGFKERPTYQTSVTITYPVFRQIAPDPTVAGLPPSVTVQAIPAQPGYKIVDAKFIVTENKGVDILHVGASPDGSVVRAAYEKSKSDVAELGKVGSLKGYIETTQVKIN